MALLIVSFIAGVLTILAPCIFPLLPVIIGGSVTETGNKKRVYIIIGSLSLSLVVFTLVLKASAALIMVPAQFWTILSSSILILFSITMIFPGLWEKISAKLKFSERSNQLLTFGYQRKNILGDVIMGAALGPVFSSCSPTYFVILASVLPASLLLGVTYLIAYSVGLSLMLFLVAWLGQKFVARVGWAVDPRGYFKRMIGVLFLLVAIFILFGYDKKVQIYVLDQGLFDVTKVENYILKKIDSNNNVCQAGSCSNQNEKESNNKSKNMENINPGGQKAVSQNAVAKSQYQNYVEIKNPDKYVNSQPFLLKDFIGKKVILLDFMTYSCINCQRTFPYLNEWYRKYKDAGLLIVGIHTPEFAFERNIENVRKATKEFGIEFPLVLDNNYSTWTAYGNRYWPHKYLIDIDGKIVYDHIGEGAYDITEMKIQDLLAEKMTRDGLLASNIEKGISAPVTNLGGTNLGQSPETYFGALRNNTPANNSLSLIGKWHISDEYAENEEKASIIYKYNAGRVFLVTSAEKPISVSVLIDGKPINKEMYGKDVVGGQFVVEDARLYEIVKGPFGKHTLELTVNNSGLKAYAFTFGS